MLKKLSHLLTKYKVQRKKLDYETSFYTYFKAVLSSVIINLVLFSVPVLLIYNLFILEYLINFLKLIIILLVPIICFMYNFIFIQISKNYHKNLENINFKQLIILESILYSLFMVIITIIVMSIA